MKTGEELGRRFSRLNETFVASEKQQDDTEKLWRRIAAAPWAVVGMILFVSATRRPRPQL